MNIGPTSAHIAANYLYSEIAELCYDLTSGEMSDDDAIINFRYAMALCDVLSELDATKGQEQEELIIRAEAEYPEEVLAEISMPNWIL